MPSRPHDGERPLVRRAPPARRPRRGRARRTRTPPRRAPPPSRSPWPQAARASRQPISTAGVKCASKRTGARPAKPRNAPLARSSTANQPQPPCSAKPCSMRSANASLSVARERRREELHDLRIGVHRGERLPVGGAPRAQHEALGREGQPVTPRSERLGQRAVGLAQREEALDDEPLGLGERDLAARDEEVRARTSRSAPTGCQCAPSAVIVSSGTITASETSIAPAALASAAKPRCDERAHREVVARRCRAPTSSSRSSSTSPRVVGRRGHRDAQRQAEAAPRSAGRPSPSPTSRRRASGRASRRARRRSRTAASRFGAPGEPRELARGGGP